MKPVRVLIGGLIALSALLFSVIAYRMPAGYAAGTVSAAEAPEMRLVKRGPLPPEFLLPDTGPGAGGADKGFALLALGALPPLFPRDAKELPLEIYRLLTPATETKAGLLPIGPRPVAPAGRPATQSVLWNGGPFGPWPTSTIGTSAPGANPSPPEESVPPMKDRIPLVAVERNAKTPILPGWPKEWTPEDATPLETAVLTLPVPASLPLFLGALASFGLIARRRPDFQRVESRIS